MIQNFWGYLILNSNNQYNAATEGGPEAGAWEILAVASYIIPHFIVCCANMTAMDGGVISTSGSDTAFSAVEFHNIWYKNSGRISCWVGVCVGV